MSKNSPQNRDYVQYEFELLTGSEVCEASDNIDLDVDANGKLYITDRDDDQIVVLTSQATQKDKVSKMFSGHPAPST